MRQRNHLYYLVRRRAQCNLPRRQTISSTRQRPGHTLHMGNVARPKMGGSMPFKPNYRHMRAERNRAKEQRKQDKLLRRQELAATRTTDSDEPEAVTGEPESEPEIVTR